MICIGEGCGSIAKISYRYLEPANVYIRSISVVEASRTEFWYSGRRVSRSSMLRVGKDIPDHCRILKIISIKNNTSATRNIRMQHCPASHLPALLSCSRSRCVFISTEGTKRTAHKIQIFITVTATTRSLSLFYVTLNYSTSNNLISSRF